MISRARALSHLSVLVLASAVAASAATIGPLSGSGFAIIDNNTTTPNSSTINNPTGGTITDITVTLDFGDTHSSTSGHTWVGDIEAQLSFGGTSVFLAQDSGGSGDLLGLFSFNDAFLGDLDQPTPGSGDLTPGEYFPQTNGALNSLVAAFGGLDAAGVWTLTIADDAVGDTGGIVGWELTIETSDAASVPEPGTITLFGLGLLGLAVAGKRRFGR